MMLSGKAFFLAALPLAICRVIPSGHVLVEKRDLSSSHDDQRGSRLQQHTILPMRIGLTQSNLEFAHDWLMDVSDPRSDKYGQHWGQEEVIAAFQPTQESVGKVMEWLSSAGISRNRVTHSDNKQWLAFGATVKEAESLLNTHYHEYAHSSGRAMAGCEEYFVPHSVQEHIDYITPALKRSFIAGKPKPKTQPQSIRRSLRSTPSLLQRKVASSRIPSDPYSLDHCDKKITPVCLQALYNFTAPDPNAEICSNNSLGIYENTDWDSQLDLDLFYTHYAPWIPNGTHPIWEGIDGGEEPADNYTLDWSVGESDLDFQLAIPIIYPQTTTLYQLDESSVDDAGLFNTFLDAIDGSYCIYSAYGETGNDPIYDPTYPSNITGGYNGTLMCGTYKPTNVISISYSAQEDTLPAYYQKRQCNELLKLALQGVSVFIASGDSGVAGNGQCLGPESKQFAAFAFASCPYITNVGMTEIANNNTVYDREIAVNQPGGFSSGGGFSNIFPRADYQEAAVEQYFAVDDPPFPYYCDGNRKNSTGVYNRNGRAFPDVAANGYYTAIYFNGTYQSSGGTSAAAPIFASLINRIVEERLKVGKGPLGFVNPAFYQHPEFFNDIVEGHAPGCGSKGFTCATGWDPVTGLGTPRYPDLLEYFLSLP